MDEFAISLAANGEEGLSHYAKIRPDIIVADIMMPKMITKLRHKLSRDTSIKILNIRGIGYKLIIG